MSAIIVIDVCQSTIWSVIMTSSYAPSKLNVHEQPHDQRTYRTAEEGSMRVINERRAQEGIVEHPNIHVGRTTHVNAEVLVVQGTGRRRLDLLPCNFRHDRVGSNAA